jgi:hypothetical protein
MPTCTFACVKANQGCFEDGKKDILVGSSGLAGAHATEASAGGPCGAGLPSLPSLPSVPASLTSSADARACGEPGKAPSAVDVCPLADRGREGCDCLGDGPGEGCAVVDTWLDPKYYSCPGAASFRVRGPNYLKDRCGVSCAALSTFRLDAMRTPLS